MIPQLPTATYRLQFNSRFTFRDAAAIMEYLADLGISHVYASPILAARPGSLHGYDIVDPTRINPELGTEEDFAEFCRALTRNGMRLILDVVPNHLCASEPGNRWWADVLENGAASPYAKYFDIDFHPAKIDLADKILLPFLGDPYGRVLESQEISVHHEKGEFVARVADHRLPLAPRSWKSILAAVEQRTVAKLGEDHPHAKAVGGLLREIDELPGPEARREYLDRRERLRERLAGMAENGDGFVDALQESLTELNGRKGEPRSFDALEALLEQQPYRLSFWRVAADEINYRRFFDINDLVAIRVEEPEVFEAVHGTVFPLIRDGIVTGLRVDHVDGLASPSRYLEDLRRRCLEARGKTEGAFTIAVEKVLGWDERLDPAWPVEGTTGYDFLNRLNGLFVEPRGLEALGAIYETFTGNREPMAHTVYASKKLVIHAAMPGELHVLALRLDRLSEKHRGTRDFTRNSLEKALAEVVACFPVYRTYAGETSAPPREPDREAIMAAVAHAKGRNRAVNESIFDFIESVLLLRMPEGAAPGELEERRDFIRRFQQLTGPVMAKGFEDTALYRRFPLASLCEVGADPERGATSVQEFHDFNLARMKSWPHSMSATATHDTKRGEDVRARLNVLSELPAAWEKALREWRAMNAPRRRKVGRIEAPVANEEYLLYQTLVGTYPGGFRSASEHAAYVARVERYVDKALREAKIHTSWISPHAAYEEAVRQFIRAILDPSHGFSESLRRFVQRIARPALHNSLAQAVLKVVSPGVPDVYQGNEFLDLRLADPDNREPVDYGPRRSALEWLRGIDREHAGAGAVVFASDDPLKMYVLRRALRYRRAHAELFASGAYVPLATAGERADQVVAFARVGAGRQAIVVSGRFFAGTGEQGSLTVAGDGWGDTAVRLEGVESSARYRDFLKGADIPVRERRGRRELDVVEILTALPAAILEPM